MMKYHHLGIPTTEAKEGEVYLPDHKVYVSGYEESEFHIEWMRYEEGSSVPLIVQKVPHVAFEVENLLEAIKGREVLIAPNSPSDGVMVAFVIENGAPIEFLEYTK